MFRDVRGFITMGYFSPVHDYSGSLLARGGDWPVTRAPRSPATRGFTVFARTRGSVTGSRQERKARCWDARGLAARPREEAPAVAAPRGRLAGGAGGEGVARTEPGGHSRGEGAAASLHRRSGDGDGGRRGAAVTAEGHREGREPLRSAKGGRRLWRGNRRQMRVIMPAEKHRRGTVPPLGSPQGRAGPGGEGTGGAGAASSSSGRRAVIAE